MKMSLLASLCGCMVVCFSLTAHTACIQPPSCDELGFTVDTSKCEGAALKCPWDLSKAACLEKEEIEIAYILYGDGTVSKNLITDKVPIGVVFDKDNRLAIALTDVKKDGTPGSEKMVWSINHCDFSGVQNCNDSDIDVGTDLSPITCGIDGRINTDKMLAGVNECGDAPAATVCNTYEPKDCASDFCKKTKWFLPSLRDIQNIYIHKNLLNTTLALLNNFGATKLNSSYYWSSTEYNDLYAWYFSLDFGNRHYYHGKGSNSFYVRPVLAF